MTNKTAAIETVSELKPCPFCGGLPEMQINGPTSEQAQYMFSHGEDWDVSYFVACQCTSTGPECAEEFDAIASWNRRSLDTADGVDRDSLRFLRQFADQYREGAAGCTMDYDAAQALALSIDDILASRPTRVRKLEWRGPFEAFPSTMWEAETPFGRYEIEEQNASDSPVYELRFNMKVVAIKDGVPEIQECAQADFNTRIRSALAITEPERGGEPQPVAWHMNGEGPEWVERDKITFDKAYADTCAASDWWTVTPLYTSPPSPVLGVSDEMANMRETMWAKVIYEGEDNSFRFELNEEGNRDGPHYDRSIEFAADTFPAGTRIVVYEPDEEAALQLGKKG